MVRRESSSLSATQRAINDAAAQSTINWARIRNTAHIWNFDELAHFSHCGVSPHVIPVACALCAQFNVTASAREQLHEDLIWQLDAFEDDSEVRVLRKLMACDGERIVLGICGILNDYFELEALPDFFDMLAKMSGMPAAMRPARVRWLELARVARRIQAPRSFHTLNQQFSHLWAAENARTDDLKECVGPMAVIDYLQSMSSISSGEDEGRIVALCGRAGDWCAAIAEWMFGLKIKLTVRDGETWEGKTIYSNCRDDQVQLTLTFNNPGIPCEGDPVVDPSMPIKKRGSD